MGGRMLASNSRRTSNATTTQKRPTNSIHGDFKTGTGKTDTLRYFTLSAGEARGEASRAIPLKTKIRVAPTFINQQYRQGNMVY
jgi:hypothetical protein